MIDRESNTLHHQAKEALYICITDPSLNRNTGKVRIPSVFNKLLKAHKQLELPHVLSPHPRRATSPLGLSHKRQLTLHTFLISIYNRSVHLYVHTFQTSRQLNLQISTFKETHRKTVFKLFKVSSSPESIYASSSLVFSSVNQTRLKKELVSSENVS